MVTANWCGCDVASRRKPHPGESGSTINGVLYAVEGEDMAKFDARERAMSGWN